MRTYFNLKHIQLLVLLVSFTKVSSQIKQSNDLCEKINQLLKESTIRPFNGTIIISRNDTLIYSKTKGVSNSNSNTQLNKNAQYYIGSISKQFTAFLILQSFEANKLKLDKPIANYLPNLTMPWKDSVTIHHLLNHTHGIQSIDEPLAFKLGSKFEYSGLGYELLGEILEAVNKKSYANLIAELSMINRLKYTIHPKHIKNEVIASGHTKNSEGTIIIKDFKPNNYSVPAGGIISNSSDLLKWNNLLHHGNLLKKESYLQMITPTVQQYSSLFGEIGYGYGLRILNSDGIKEIGHTGYVPGFISMNLFYPETNTSLIILENIDWEDNDIKKTFYFEIEIRELLRKSSLLN